MENAQVMTKPTMQAATEATKVVVKLMTEVAYPAKWSNGPTIATA